jgi:hypothetical protein
MKLDDKRDYLSDLHQLRAGESKDALQPKITYGNLCICYKELFK